MKWSYTTDTGLVRSLNEDSLCLSPETGFFAVADGMGGHKAGEVASRTALQIIKRELDRRLGLGVKPADALVEAIKEANRTIYEMAAQNADWAGMGTTITACLKNKNHVLIGQVGDSRAYLLRGSEIARLTEDHSLVQQMVKNGGITEEQAFKHPQRNVLTRALGTATSLEVDLYKVKVKPREMLLICTDGLTGYLRQEELSEIITTAPDLDTAVDRLLKKAIQSGGADNITIILVEF
ncbi:Stp1/IreP family PP2C-type Ser/Thr phosphatase [Pelotomaculum propionicicum]|uniref:Serine/threonine phosphatase stp n=1 Tax=Pelotomaculum propionicicum TaxID=258475 RepID=A0A4Y7RNK2_9FIRM|nr:Stp1/IreP family PP2C-type Ser/Thr phosphatase [Pelotomaculum propionicicum]NLI11254.1 Stp1/IreP family PP2C-type Ser/Thr phosphatase [Peptococcaceae bacterium]TEB10568.1 Serine/threonine phosphatase stp [Pelotomaculum propionicicum]